MKRKMIFQLKQKYQSENRESFLKNGAQLTDTRIEIRKLPKIQLVKRRLDITNKRVAEKINMKTKQTLFGMCISCSHQ